MLPPCTAKSNVPLVQLLRGIVTITCFDSPGESIPLAGLKVAPLRSVLADQFRFPCELGSSVSVNVQVKTLFVLSNGHVWTSVLPTFAELTSKIGGVLCCNVMLKVTVTVTILDPSLKMSTSEGGLALRLPIEAFTKTSCVSPGVP